ncbi:sigma-70 family RNA polymerase sigma factor [Rubritalea tangerina]|uniref:Sigma-70 family RNA polymerase sigma factor n=2 Tax=Rubritalea tangerina TaxID=430798 RepID=A0ABW4ZCT9_9BACT
MTAISLAKMTDYRPSTSSHTANADAAPQASASSLLAGIQGPLRGYIISLTSNANDYDDILQNTNAYLVTNLDKYTPGTNFKAWAFRVAYLRIKESIRARQRNTHAHLSDAMLEQLSHDAVELCDSDDERYHFLAKCLATLKVKDKQLVQQHYLHRISLTQIAQDSNRTPSALHKAISRIRKTLRMCIDAKS